MELENIKLDINFVKSQFPAFEDSLCKDWSFFENAGGSYVPQQVVDRLNKFMISNKVQPYAEYPMSKIAGNNMDKATELFANMINASSKEIIIGGSTSINLYVLSNALKYSLKPGDEVIVTNQDHEANISPWRRLSEVGAIIKEWKMNPKTAELEIETLEKLLSDKTKIVAVTHCSNIVGSINDLKKISKLVHEKNAIIIGDGVSYAPHGFPNVKELDVDFYTFSLYKTYGPHLALLYGKEEILKKLPNQNHEFLKDSYPYTINPGGPNHEELSSLIGIYEESKLSCSTHPHNTYIQILAETGIIGFFFIIIALYYFSKYIIKHIRFKFNASQYFNDFEICILSGIAIYLWPFIPTGSFFTNMTQIYLTFLLTIIFMIENQLFNKSYKAK